MKIGLVCTLALVALVQGASITRDKHQLEKREVFDMVEYLERYGYLPNAGKSPEDEDYIFHSEASLEYALGMFQEFNGLPVTRMMDRKTRDLMRKPRCGFKDIVDSKDPSQPQSYTHLGRKWPKSEITWKTTNWTHKLRQTDQRRAMENAFQFWADVTPLTFTYTEGTPDIEVKFAQGEHGDGALNAFDGKGNTLAHAFGPGNVPISGDTHFDNDEDWTYHETRGTELETVAAHEFGHALGLGHSKAGTLMAPYYQGYDPNFKLSADDIRGIQLLYGSNPGRPTTTTAATTTTTDKPTTSPTKRTTTTETTKPNPDICSIKLDAIVTAHDGYTYAFRRNKVYKFGSQGLETGFPRRISDVFPRARRNIRGAFYNPEDKKTYLFKNSKLWRYTKFDLDVDFPQTIITEDFPETKIQAILTMKDSYSKQRVFMFGSNKFWEWNPSTLRMVPGWSYNIVDHWRGVPRGVEAAVTWYDGHMYFFKGSSYRKFDTNYRSVLPGFPMPWAPVWMRNVCFNSPSGMKEAEMQWDIEAKMADVERGTEMRMKDASNNWPFSFLK